MNLDHLTPSEIEVECTVRHISGSQPQRLTKLRSELSKEKLGQSLSPGQPHAQVKARPRLELETCTSKLKDIIKLFRDQVSTDDNQVSDFSKEQCDILSSKVIHIQGRLSRLNKIPELITRVNYLLEICSQLSKNFSELSLDRTQLEKTVKSIDTIEIGSDTSEPELEIHPSVIELNKTINIPNSEQNNPSSMSPSNGISATPFRDNAYSQPYRLLRDLVQSSTQSDHLLNPHTGAKDCETFAFSPFSAPNNSNRPRATVSNLDGNMLAHPSSNINHVHFNPMLSSPYDALETNYPINNNYPTEPNSLLYTTQGPTTTTRHPSSSRVALAKVVRNLKFDGSVNGISIDKFIYRFEAIAFDHGIPMSKLIEEVHGFLDGAAQEYYWCCRETHHSITWPQMRSLLKDRFQDFRTDPIIKSAMEARRQKSNEAFIDFYNDLVSMSVSLRSPMSSTELISLVMKNMRNALQYELASWIPHSLPELVQRCVNAEHTWRRLGAIPSGHIQGRSVHEIQFPTEYPTQTQIQYRYPEQVPSPSPINDIPNPSNYLDAMNRPQPYTVNSMRCWNCSGQHRFQECDIPIRSIFCFGCGKKDVLKPNCPICKSRSQGNRTEGMRPSGISHFLPKNQGIPKTEVMEAASNTDPELYKMNYQILKRH